MKKWMLAAGLLLLYTIAIGQPTGPWRGKPCAVVLTYDDALTEHLTNVAPALDSLGLKATFYLSGYFPGFVNNVERWRAVARNGHELGNHTLFHPCVGGRPGREWVQPTRDLSAYTVPRMTDEIRMTNVLLNALDGKTTRTFAYPCGDKKIGEVAYYPLVEQAFVAARGVQSAMKPITALNYADIDAYGINGETGEQLIELVRKAQQTGSLVVFLFHGVGGGHALNVALPEHNKLLRYLKQHEDSIWIAPLAEVVTYAKKQSKSLPATR